MKLDVVAWPVIAEIVKQIRIVFDDRDLDVTRVAPLWAENAILDVGSDGAIIDQAWVRLMSQLPARTFPATDAAPSWGGRQNPAVPGRLATTLEVGMVHCTTWAVDENFSPSAEQYMADAERSAAEMAALRQAISEAMLVQKREHQFVSFSALNDGLASGGFWQVTFDWIRGER